MNNIFIITLVLCNLFLIYKIYRMEILIESASALHDGMCLIIDRTKTILQLVENQQQKLDIMKKRTYSNDQCGTNSIDYESQLKAIHDHLKLIYQSLPKSKKS